MSRSGYSHDIDQWDLIRWRGAVAAAIRGKRGQAFLLEMWKAITALPEPKLIANELVEKDGAVCAMGAVGKQRGIGNFRHLSRGEVCCMAANGNSRFANYY